MVGPMRLGVPKTTFSLDSLYEDTVTIVYILPLLFSSGAPLQTETIQLDRHDPDRDH